MIGYGDHLKPYRSTVLLFAGEGGSGCGETEGGYGGRQAPPHYALTPRNRIPAQQNRLQPHRHLHCSRVEERREGDQSEAGSKLQQERWVREPRFIGLINGFLSTIIKVPVNK